MKRKAIVGGAVKGKAGSPQQGSRDELLRESHVGFGPQQHGERMAALVQAQRRLASTEATPEELLIGDDAAVLGEFMLDFLEGAVQAATELANALAAGYVARAVAVAHRLKSSARAVGALHLGELCEAIERDANAAADCESLAAMRARFDAELARVREWIDAQGWNRASALQGAEAE